MLEEGYEIAIRSVDLDGNKAYIELFKDEYLVDSKIIIHANKGDGTYIYLDPETGAKLEIHFKKAFRAADINLATIDRHPTMNPAGEKRASFGPFSSFS